MDGGAELGSEMATKTLFSGLERRHAGETLDEMHVSMARRGFYLSGRDRDISKNWKREF